MAVLQFSDLVRNARLDAIETVIAASPHLHIRSGAAPANCAAADAGTLLCDIVLPADYMSAAAAGVKALLGTWSGTGAAAAGGGTNAAHFRIKDAAATVCHVQGDITATGGGGAMTLDNISISNGQTVSVTTFTLTDPNN